MIRKISAITIFALLAATSLKAQNRDFRKERAELAREEREEKRRLKAEMSHQSRPSYGTNILRLSPISALDIGVGFGASYEKIIGAEQMIGVVLPVYLMLENKSNYNPWPGQYNGNDAEYNAYFYFTPGVKIYPFGQRKVTYAVGPNLVFGYGGGKEMRYDNMYSYSELVTITKLRIGMLVNNYVNFQITPSFNLGLEAGLGVRYIDRETWDSLVLYDNVTYSRGINATGVFSFTIGYRF